MFLFGIGSIKNPSVNGKLDHVIAVVEQKSPEHRICTAFGSCNNRQIEKNEKAHMSSRPFAHELHLSLMLPKPYQSREFNFFFAITFVNARQAFY